MPKFLPILTVPTPSLRVPSTEVDPALIGTPEFQLFLDQLIESMHVGDGIGIAAPQVGRNERVFVVNEKGKPRVYINPVVTAVGDSTIQSEEGCLSVPGVWGIVERAKKIAVVALDRHGRRIEGEAKNLMATVFQHERDHLDGILFIDKVTKITKGEGKIPR